MAFSAAAKYANVARELQKVPSRVSSQAAPAIERMWRKSYRAEQDPYGRPWAKLSPRTIAKKGFDTIMVEKGDTYKETRVRALPGAGIGLQTGYKAQWHLEATENRPARPVLPLHGLPAPWRERIRKITVDAARKAARARG
jgi:hypothetical protein